jgi:hypothetical protein
MLPIEEGWQMARLIAAVVFSGDDPDLDVGQAIAELHAAGYGVRRMPERYRSRLAVWGHIGNRLNAPWPATLLRRTVVARRTNRA